MICVQCIVAFAVLLLSRSHYLIYLNFMQLFLGVQADNGDQATPKNKEAIGEMANQAAAEAGEHMGMTVARPYSRYRFQSNIVCCVMLCGIALTRNICCGMCASVEALATCLAVYFVCSHNIFCDLCGMGSMVAGPLLTTVVTAAGRATITLDCRDLQ